MFQLPPECPETLEHALLHLKNIADDTKGQNSKPDITQIAHDVSMAIMIISNIEETKNRCID